MTNYNIPSEFYFRLHHVRPRFKGDIENVLIFMAEEVVKIGKLKVEDFSENMRIAIRNYPGNSMIELKTINNWRTEISALFGFVLHRDDYDEPGQRAMELEHNQDLVEFFKLFLFSFQYPGAHIKSQAVLEQINAGIHFKPAQYILKLLRYANSVEKSSVGITKFEVCHCIYNDLRCTRDKEEVSNVWNRIKVNRELSVQYDQTGDVIRYAGDIIDYMEIANLLKTYDSRTYYLNTLEESSIIKFTESCEWFNAYDQMINNRSGNIVRINEVRDQWFEYVNRDLGKTDFSTDILAFIANDAEDLKKLKENVELISVNREILSNDFQKREEIIGERIRTEKNEFRTKDIGDMGESIIHSHECMRVKMNGREDLLHLIKRIPTQFALGYDIVSVELDERKRFIEVKTTISSKPLHFNRIHMTKNEWNTANSTRDRYFVYRLLISKEERRLFLLQDPVGLYKSDQINMIPSDGAEINFNPNNVGYFEDLLTWRT